MSYSPSRYPNLPGPSSSSNVSIPQATNGLGCIFFLLLAALGGGISFLLIKPPVPEKTEPGFWLAGLFPAALGLILGYLIFLSLRIARQWEKAVVLRLGRFSHISGPGIFFVWPIFDSISSIIDTRVQLTAFKAEQTLSKDTVPVDVDAVLFWFVWDAQKAALAVADFKEAVSWAAQTALRDTIGKTNLADLLAGRDRIEFELKKMIDERTEPWGITVQTVEMRDVLIPVALQDAMSKEAQAQRERHARVILSQAEVEVAEKFNLAAQIYASNPAAMQLRSMNMLSEAIKERGALVIVPNNAVETLGTGSISGIAAMAQQMLPNAPQMFPKVPEPRQDANPNGQLNVNPQVPRPPQQPNNAAPYTPWPQTGQGGPNDPRQP